MTASKTPLTDAEARLHDAGMGAGDPSSFEFVDTDFARSLELAAQEMATALEELIGKLPANESRLIRAALSAWYGLIAAHPHS